MEFAKEQLAKHGWKLGQGLGKNETGITEPVKAKIKNDTTGVGHDAGKEFSFHWWDHMFNKAASSIQVETTENGVAVKKSDSAHRKKNKSSKTYDNKAVLYSQFVKGATLSDGRYKAEDNVESQEDSDHDQPSKSAIIPANEEELFKQCGGRTAHKGARHGLKLNGKLARIEQQEQKLLDRLTNKSTNQTSDDNSVTSSAIDRDSANDIGDNIRKKQKKKKKRKVEEKVDVENTESYRVNENGIESHSKPCKKKRKKDKREKKYKEETEKDCINSEFDGNLDTELNDTVSDKTEDGEKFKTTEYNVKHDMSEGNGNVDDLTLRKVKKKKKKNKKAE